ncbi:MAG: hypothetical protein CSA72_06840 [Rhodobacterales bacterium]|nr:MAG: hypothetical protein CSA72_06840 [Rhodobacterales bacterium]
MIGTFVIGAFVGYIAEQTGFVRNGYLPSVIIALGGAMLFFFIRSMFNVSFGSPGLDAVISAAGALIIVPTHWRR